MNNRILLVLIGSTVTFLTPGSGEAGVGDWLKKKIDQTKEQVEKVEKKVEQVEEDVEEQLEEVEQVESQLEEQQQEIEKTVEDAGFELQSTDAVVNSQALSNAAANNSPAGAVSADSGTKNQALAKLEQLLGECGALPESRRRDECVSACSTAAQNVRLAGSSVASSMVDFCRSAHRSAMITNTWDEEAIEWMSARIDQVRGAQDECEKLQPGPKRSICVGYCERYAVTFQETLDAALDERSRAFTAEFKRSIESATEQCRVAHADAGAVAQDNGHVDAVPKVEPDSSNVVETAIADMRRIQADCEAMPTSDAADLCARRCERNVDSLTYAADLDPQLAEQAADRAKRQCRELHTRARR